MRVAVSNDCQRLSPPLHEKNLLFCSYMRVCLSRCDDDDDDDDDACDDGVDIGDDDDDDQEMEREGVSPNEVSYNTAIRACGDAGRLPEALSLMDDMERNGVRPSVVTYGTAVAACQRQADWEMVRGERERDTS